MAEIIAFSARQASRLTGLSLRQLRYWDNTRFFRPSLAEDLPHSRFARVYAFKDIVGLRALSQMRKAHGIPLQQLRQVGSYLSRRYDEPWSRLTFYIVGKMVFYQSEEAVQSADEQHQSVMPFAMKRIESEVRLETEKMMKRCPEHVGLIERNRYIAENKPVVAGTRTTTAAIWNFHRSGYTAEHIIGEYPKLRLEDVRAAVDFEKRRQETQLTARLSRAKSA